MEILRSWLMHPLTRELDIDDPATTQLRHQIIREKPFLRKIYEEWYTGIVAALPEERQRVLELGSGAGFLGDFVPGVMTSDLFYSSNIKFVLSGLELPFADSSLDGIVMINVLHHLPQARKFFAEASRCLRSGGAIVMSEPWVTVWSRMVYKRLHHELFDPVAKEWNFPYSGPLSGANGALPWIIFARDRDQFEQEFPEMRIRSIKPDMPFSYLVSGGVSLRTLMPGWTYRLWRGVEHLLQPVMNYGGMFAQIVVLRE